MLATDARYVAGSARGSPYKLTRCGSTTKVQGHNGSSEGSLSAQPASLVSTLATGAFALLAIPGLPPPDQREPL